MASNVYGAPVTDETLKAMPKYANKPTTTRLERAREALKNQNAGGKLDSALQYVKNLQGQYGDGASTKCVIYNATGDKVTYVLDHDYHGNIYTNSPYPLQIENGQWGAFLHVRTTGELVGSSAAVVYKGQNNDGEAREWCLSWITPGSSDSNKNCAYAEARRTGNYQNDMWGHMEGLMEHAGTKHDDEWGGCVSKGKIIGSGTTVHYSGTMTLEGADKEN